MITVISKFCLFVVAVSLIYSVVILYYRRKYTSNLVNVCADKNFNDVSVVIAARDEEQEIERCLNSLLKQRMVKKIIVVDDHSSDNTSVTVQRIAKTDDRVKLIQSPELPAGWIGKNHALHVGSLSCNSQYILFSDADVHFKEGVVETIRNYMTSRSLDHVGGMFGIECRTYGEKICAPILFTAAFTALSLTANSIGAGTGAFNMLRLDTYKKIGRHLKIRNKILDDISLARLVKSKGNSCAFLDMSKHITVRLFRGFKGYWQAVERSAVPFLGNTVWLTVTIALLGFGLAAVIATIPLIATVYAFHFIQTGKYTAGYYAYLLMLAYICGAIPFMLFKACPNSQRTWSLLYPFPFILMTMAVFVSCLNKLLGKPIFWRGREYGRLM